MQGDGQPYTESGAYPAADDSHGASRGDTQYPCYNALVKVGMAQTRGYDTISVFSQGVAVPLGAAGLTVPFQFCHSIARGSASAPSSFLTACRLPPVPFSAKACNNVIAPARNLETMPQGALGAVDPGGAMARAQRGGGEGDESEGGEEVEEGEGYDGGSGRAWKAGMVAQWDSEGRSVPGAGGGSATGRSVLAPLQELGYGDGGRSGGNISGRGAGRIGGRTRGRIGRRIGGCGNISGVSVSGGTSGISGSGSRFSFTTPWRDGCPPNSAGVTSATGVGTGTGGTRADRSTPATASGGV